MKVIPILLILTVLVVVLFIVFFDRKEAIVSANPAPVVDSVVRMPIPEPNMSYAPHVGQPGMINERKYDTYPAPAPGQILTPLPVHQLRGELRSPTTP